MIKERDKINQEICFESACFHNFFYNNGKTLSHLKVDFPT